MDEESYPNLHHLVCVGVMKASIHDWELIRNEIVSYFEETQAHIAELEAKLNSNRCNSGHETLPLSLWVCPACCEEREGALKAEIERLRGVIRERAQVIGAMATAIESGRVYDADIDWPGTLKPWAEKLIAAIDGTLEFVTPGSKT